MKHKKDRTSLVDGIPVVSLSKSVFMLVQMRVNWLFRRDLELVERLNDKANRNMREEAVVVIFCRS